MVAPIVPEAPPRTQDFGASSLPETLPHARNRSSLATRPQIFRSRHKFSEFNDLRAASDRFVIVWIDFVQISFSFRLQSGVIHAYSCRQKA